MRTEEIQLEYDCFFFENEDYVKGCHGIGIYNFIYHF